LCAEEFALLALAKKTGRSANAREPQSMADAKVLPLFADSVLHRGETDQFIEEMYK
jgi:hypothetical protein